MQKPPRKKQERVEGPPTKQPVKLKRIRVSQPVEIKGRNSFYFEAEHYDLELGDLGGILGVFINGTDFVPVSNIGSIKIEKSSGN